MQFASLDLLEALKTKVTVRHRNAVSFLTLRSWPAGNRQEAVAAFRREKKTKTVILVTAAHEIAAELGMMVGPGWSVTSIACGHSREHECWGKVLARTVAEKLKVPFLEVFEDRFVDGVSHPKEFRKLPPLQIRQRPEGPILIVDDVATSGWHLEEASMVLREFGSPVFACAWIAGTIADVARQSGDLTIGKLFARRS